MKHKHMFSLLDQSFTTVLVAFGGQSLPPGMYEATIDGVEFVDSPRQGSKRTLRTQFSARVEERNGYVYKVPKAWDVKEGDYLVVESPSSGLCVVNVLRADASPDIDVDANFDYKWAVTKIDMTEYEQLVDREKQFNTTMLDIERVKQREQLVESFRNSLPEGSEARRLFEQTTQSLTPPTVDAGASSESQG